MAHSLEFWFRRKYGLTPSDPRFLELTTEDIEAEYWAYHYQEHDGQQEAEDDDFDLDAEIARMNDEDWEEVPRGRTAD